MGYTNKKYVDELIKNTAGKRKKMKRKTVEELSEMADQMCFILDQNTSNDAERFCVVSFMQFGISSRAAYFTNKRFEKRVKECKSNLEQEPSRGVA